MKKLIILTHPSIETSIINKRWKQELQKHPDLFTIHDLYETYPDGKINIRNEQKLLEEHDHIVFQYPLYWFSYPPFLKQWLDEVLLHGWAYGTNGNKMKDKKIFLAISAGIKEIDYREDGLYEGTIEQLSLPFKMTAQYINAKLEDIFTWYDVEQLPTPENIEKSAIAYRNYLNSF